MPASSVSSASARSRSPTTSPISIPTRRGGRSRRGRVASGATPTSCPSRRRPGDPLEPGLTPLIRADRLARPARPARDLDQERRGQPDALVQGPRRRRRDRQGAGARLRDGRLRLDREPRERGRRPRRRRRPRLLRLRALEPRGAEAARHRHLRDQPGRHPRHLRRRQPALHRAEPDARPGRSSTSTFARTTPRARRRSPSRRSSSSAGTSRTASSLRSPPARCSPRSPRACATGSSWDWSRASCRPSAAPRPRAARRSPPPSRRAGTSASPSAQPETIAKSLAIGDPADGPYALELARSTGGVIESVTDDEIRDGIRLLAETTGVFTETAGGVTVGVLTKLAETRRDRPGRAGRRLHHRRGTEDPRRRPRVVPHARDRADPRRVRAGIPGR